MSIGKARFHTLIGVIVLCLASWQVAADAGHSHTDEAQGAKMLEQMKEVHKGHEHGHDFEAMEV